MAKPNILAARKHVVKPSEGNSGFRFKDSTASVAGNILSGSRPQVTVGGKKGCSSCGK